MSHQALGFIAIAKGDILVKVGMDLWWCQLGIGYSGNIAVAFRRRYNCAIDVNFITVDHETEVQSGTLEK